MSGGSFNYLCWHTDDLASRIEEVERMADLLGIWPDASKAASATWQVTDLLQQAAKLAESLQDVWHDVEWWQSCDYSEADARKTAVAWADETPRDSG